MESQIEFCCEVSEDDRRRILALLPDIPTKILSTKIAEDMLQIRLLNNCSDREEIDRWLKEYEERTFSGYSVHSTSSCNGKYVAVKRHLRCKRNTRCKTLYDAESGTRCKNTNCPAGIIVTLHAAHRNYRGKDKARAELLKQMACEVFLNAFHNHETNSPDALRLRGVSDEVEERLTSLLESGHSALSARKYLQIDIQLNHENHEEILADRMYYPDYMFVYHLQQKVKKKECQSKGPNRASHDDLQRQIDEYNQKMKDVCAKMIVVETDCVICICPRMFKRVHQYCKSAARTVFLDWTPTSEGGRVYLLTTDEECGGLPLGVLIASSSNPSLLGPGLQLLKDLAGGHVFGNNPDGPSIIYSDDSTEVRAAIGGALPRSKNLLCVFHTLRAVWNWLADSGNGIPEEEQSAYFEDFKYVLYASDVDDCAVKYVEAKEIIRHHNYAALFERYWRRRTLWALSCRSDPTTDNNLSEAVTKVVTCKIFGDISQLSRPQLVDFFLGEFVCVYELRLLEAAINNLRRNILGQLIRIPRPELLEGIQILKGPTVMVPSCTKNNTFYVTNVSALHCTCLREYTGELCKHLDWASIFVASEKFTSLDKVENRELFYYIATGNKLCTSDDQKLENDDDYCSEFSSIDHKDELLTLQTRDIGKTLAETTDNLDQDTLETTNVVNCKTEDDAEEQCGIIIEEIRDTFLQHSENSPGEVAGALKKFVRTMRRFQTTSEFVSGISSFGNGLQETTSTSVRPVAIGKRKLKLLTEQQRVWNKIKRNE